MAAHFRGDTLRERVMLAWAGFSVLLLSTQALLYAKSGMAGRYYFPAIVCPAVLLAASFDSLVGFVKKARTIAWPAALVALALLYFGPARLAWPEAREYAHVRQTFTAFLNSVAYEGAGGGKRVLIMYTDKNPSAFYELALASIPVYIRHRDSSIQVYWSAPNACPDSEFEKFLYARMKKVMRTTFVAPFSARLATFPVIGVCGRLPENLTNRCRDALCSNYSYGDKYHVSVCR
jgi:hypothetical protein